MILCFMLYWTADCVDFGYPVNGYDFGVETPKEKAALVHLTIAAFVVIGFVDTIQLAHHYLRRYLTIPEKKISVVEMVVFAQVVGCEMSALQC